MAESMTMMREEALKAAKPILFNSDMVKAIQDNTKIVTRRLIKSSKVDLSECVFVEMSEDPSELRVSKDGTEYPHDLKGLYATFKQLGGEHFPLVKVPCQVGDILYVRETFFEYKGHYHYKADGKHIALDKLVGGAFFKWQPSIHMPKEAARLFLRITDVRIEHLQDITEEQAIREGIARLFDYLPDAEYIDWAKRTGVYPKSKADWGYKNYLWHGNFGMYGTGNKLSDAWEYQCSAYDSAIDSFSSLWNTTVPLKDWNIYGWDANPWVFVIEFERLEVTG